MSDTLRSYESPWTANEKDIHEDFVKAYNQILELSTPRFDGLEVRFCPKCGFRWVYHSYRNPSMTLWNCSLCNISIGYYSAHEVKITGTWKL